MMWAPGHKGLQGNEAANSVERSRQTHSLRFHRTNFWQASPAARQARASISLAHQKLTGPDPQLQKINDRLASWFTLPGHFSLTTIQIRTNPMICKAPTFELGSDHFPCMGACPIPQHLLLEQNRPLCTVPSTCHTKVGS